MDYFSHQRRISCEGCSTGFELAGRGEIEWSLRVAISEYYIRQPDSEEARGPYDLGRIGDLIDAGKADISTLYFDEEREDWIALTDNPDFREILFPEKRRLSLRAKEIADRLNADSDGEDEVSVADLLAAAEGKSDDTRQVNALQIAQTQAAGIGMMSIGISLVVSAVFCILPLFSSAQILISEGRFLELLLKPLLILGLADLFFALCCFLSATDIYRLIRIRMAIGIGFFGYVFWATGEPVSAVVAMIASLSVAIITISVNLGLVIFCSLLALAGFGYLVYLGLF